VNCPICGSESRVETLLQELHAHRVMRSRICVLGHRFHTFEVHLTQLADAREMACALRNIERRVKRWQRDLAIARDPRPVKIVAADYNITDARVRQIRASFPVRD